MGVEVEVGAGEGKGKERMEVELQRLLSPFVLLIDFVRGAEAAAISEPHRCVLHSLR